MKDILDVGVINWYLFGGSFRRFIENEPKEKLTCMHGSSAAHQGTLDGKSFRRHALALPATRTVTSHFVDGPRVLTTDICQRQSTAQGLPCSAFCLTL